MTIFGVQCVGVVGYSWKPKQRIQPNICDGMCSDYNDNARVRGDHLFTAWIIELRASSPESCMGPQVLMLGE